MLPNFRHDKVKQFQQGSPYSTRTFIDELNRYLKNKAGSPSEYYQAEWSETESYGGYRRLIISGQEFKGQRSLVLDVRLGPETATGEPAMFIRSRAPVGQASEYVIGNKVMPGPQLDTGETPYSVVGTAESVADLARATFRSTLEARTNDLYKRDPLPIEELFSIFTNRNTSRYEKLREKYGVPTGYQLSWGMPTQGEQSQLAAYLPLILGQGNINEQLSIIEREMGVEGSLSRLLNLGVYMPKREDTGSFGLTRIAHTLKYQTREGLRETLAMVHRGAQQEGGIPFDDPVEALLKQDKMVTSVFGSRQPVFPVEEVQQDMGTYKRNILRPRTAYSYENLTAEESAHFGELMLSGDYKRLVNLNVLMPGETKGRDVRLTMGLVTSVPSASGGVLFDPRELAGDAGYAFYSGQAFDLPWSTGRELSAQIRGATGKQALNQQLKMVSNLIGRQIQAGAQGYTVGHIQVPGREEPAPLTLEGKEYLRQIEGATIVLPPLMSKKGGVFYTAREQADPYKGGTGADLISTQALADSLTEIWGPSGINVQISGQHNQPYLYINTMGVIGSAAKGFLSIKGGEQPVPDLGVRMHAGTSAGKLLKLGAVTEEVKQPIEAFTGAFAVQPYENKLKMLAMVDPRLPDFLKARHLGPEGGLQPIDMEELGRHYGRLKGKPERGHYLFLMSELYEKFMAADTKQNEENMKRYGVFYLQGGGEVSAGVFHESIIKAQQHALDIRNKQRGENLTLADIGIRVTPTKNEGYYNYYFTAPEKRSIAHPFTTGMSAEYPGQGRNINKDIVLSTLANYPQFAQARGIMPGPQRENMSVERRSWLGVAGAYAFNEASMKGDVWFPDRFNENYVTIDKKKAEQLLLNLKGIDPVAGLDMTEQQRMESIVEQFGWKGLFFEKTGRFLPSPRAVEGIDEYQIIRNLGESRAHYITQFISSLEELIHAEASDRDIGTLNKHTAFMAGRESRIGKILSGDKDVVKKMFGNEVIGAGSGKYGVLDVLQPGEAYLGRSEIYRLGESMGLKSKRQKEELYRKIQEGGSSALFYRYPTLDKELGVMPVKLVSEAEIAKRAGFSMEEFAALSPGLIWIDPHTQQPFVGDRDRDPAGWMLGMDIVRDKSGKPLLDPDGNLIFVDELGTDERFQKFFAENRSYKRFYSALERVVGPQKANQYSSIAAPLIGYAENYLDRTSKTLGPLKARFEFGTQSIEDVIRSGMLFQGIMARRGTSHIATNLFKKAAGVLGAPDELLREATTGIGALYQSSLEANRVAATMTPMEMLMNTIMFGPEGGDVQSDQLALSGAMKLKYDESERRHKLAYVDLWNTGMNSQRNLMINMVKYMTQMDTFGPETLALGFASQDSMTENYNAILQVLKNTPREEWAANLLGQGTWGNFITKGAIDETSVFGTTFMSLAALRTQKLAGVGDERGAKLAGMLGHKYRIPYAGEMYSVQQFLELPAVQAIASMWQAATGKEFGGEGSGFLDASQLEQLEQVLPATARTGHSFADIVLNLGNFFGVGRGKKEVRAPGGMTSDDLIQEIRFGPKLFRASEMASIAAGVPEVAQRLGLEYTARSKGNYGPAGLLKIASKWIGGLIGQGQMGQIDTMTSLSPDAEEAARRGEVYEKTVALAGTDYLWKKGAIRTPSGYTVKAAGLTHVPHASAFKVESVSAEFDVPVGTSGLMISKEVTGSVDMIGLQTDDDTGEEYLHIQELKFGGSRTQSAGVQAVIYRDILKKMAADNPQELRKVLEGWQKKAIEQHEALRKGTPWEGELPGIAEEGWVDKAISALQEGRIRLSTAHGAGDYGFAMSGTRPVYRMMGVAKEIEDLDTTQIIASISEEVSSTMVDKIAKQLFELWTTGNVSLVGGSNLNIGPGKAPLNVMQQFFGWMTNPSHAEKIGMPWMETRGINPDEPDLGDDIVENLKKQGLESVKFVEDAIRTGTKPGERVQQPPRTYSGTGDVSGINAQSRPGMPSLPGPLRARGAKRGMTVHPRERMRNIGAATVVEYEGRIDQVVSNMNTLTELVGNVVKAIGGGAGGGSSFGGGIQAGGMPAGPGGSGDIQKRTQILTGMAAFTRMQVGEGEIRDLAKRTEDLRLAMADAGMAVGPEIDWQQGDIGDIMSRAEAVFTQAVTSGGPGIQAQAVDLGKPLQVQQMGLSRIRTAHKLLRREENRALMEEMFVGGEGGAGSMFPGGAGIEMLDVMNKMIASAGTPGAIVGGDVTSQLAYLGELGIDIGKMYPAEAKKRQTAAEHVGAAAELSPERRQRVYEDAIKSIEKLGQAADKAEAPLIEVAKTAEGLKASRQQITDQLQQAGLPYTRAQLRQAMPRMTPEQIETSELAIDTMERFQAQEADTRQKMQGMIEGRSTKWGRLSRGIFGGFGWMFLMRSLGMGLRGITEGYEESQQFLAQQEQARMRYFGTGAVTPRAAAPFYARERAMISKGERGLGGFFYDLQTQMTGTMAGDIWTGVKTGAGLTMAGTFLASELASAGAIGTAGLSAGLAAAGGVGLLTAGVAMPLLSQYSYMQNRDATLSAVAAQQRRQERGDLGGWSRWWAGVSAGWQQWGIRQQEMFQEVGPQPQRSDYATADQYITALNRWEQRTKDFVAPSDIQVAETNRMVRDYMGGGLNVPRGQEQEMANRLLQTMISPGGMPSQLEGIPTEILSNVMLQQFAVGGGQTIGVGQLEKLSRLMLAGVPTEQMYGQAVQAGMLPTQQNMWNVQQLISGVPQVARMQQLGLERAGEMSAAGRLQLGLTPTPEGLMVPSELVGELGQRPEWETIRQGAEVRGAAALRGVTLPEPPTWQGDQIPRILQQREAVRMRLISGPSGQRMTEQEIGEYVRRAVPLPELGGIPFEEDRFNVFAQQQLSRRDQYIGQGWNQQQVDAAMAMYQQAFEAGPQAMAWMPQAEQFMQQGIQYGMAPEAMMPAAMGIGQMAAQGQFGQINTIMAAMRGDPVGIARMQMLRAGPGQPPSAFYQGGLRLPVDVTSGGQVTGMQMFQSYVPFADAQRMFAPGWQNRPIGAATFGANIGGFQYQGQWAVRAEAAQRGYEAQMAGIGAQQAGLALTREYYLGGPRFGRGLFAVQDAQRALGYEQTEWQFGRQRQQLAMQGTQFRENQALQWQGMQMQRRFTQGQWAFQDQTRALQWGWRQEDFAENVRFMTGRQRKLAERQMERETIMHGMEEENIQRQRDNQKEMWGLEDERFRLVREHFEEQQEFQKEGIKDQEDFYKQRRKLEEEMVEMQRTYMLEQLKIQESSIGAQAEYAELMHQHQLDLIAQEQTISQTVDAWGQAVSYTDIIKEIFDEIRKFIEDVTDIEIPEMPEGFYEPIQPPGNPPEDKDDDFYDPIQPPEFAQQHGGPLKHNLAYLVGERGPEILMPRPSPWSNSFIPTQGGYQSSDGTPNQVTIYIGNERLGTFVIDAITKELHVG